MFHVIHEQGNQSEGRLVDVKFSRKRVLRFSRHLRRRGGVELKNGRVPPEAAYGVVIFFFPFTSTWNTAKYVCRWVLTDTGHVLATSSGLSLFPWRLRNILSSQTTAAAVLNKLLARVCSVVPKSSTLLFRCHAAHANLRLTKLAFVSAPPCFLFNPDFSVALNVPFQSFALSVSICLFDTASKGVSRRHFTSPARKGLGDRPRG